MTKEELRQHMAEKHAYHYADSDAPTGEVVSWLHVKDHDLSELLEYGAGLGHLDHAHNEES